MKTKPFAWMIGLTAFLTLNPLVVGESPLSDRKSPTETDIRRLQAEIYSMDRQQTMDPAQRQAMKQELFEKLRKLQSTQRDEQELLAALHGKKPSVSSKKTVEVTDPKQMGVDLGAESRPPFWDGFTLPNRLVLYSAMDLQLDRGDQRDLEKIAQSFQKDQFVNLRQSWKRYLARHSPEQPMDSLAHYIVRLRYIDSDDNLSPIADQVDTARRLNDTALLHERQTQFNQMLDANLGLTVAVQRSLAFLIEIGKESNP